MGIPSWIVIASCTLHTFVSSESDHHYDAIIMGAGASGIAAAKTLYESGMTDILIIEAQDYIGGRAKVVDFAGHSLNVGASWISGACVGWDNCSNVTTETNPMLVAATKYNISWISIMNDIELFLDTDGEPISSNTTWAVYDKYYSAAYCVDALVANQSVDAYDDSYASALSQCGWREPLSNLERTIQWYLFDFDGISTKYSPSFWDLDGEDTVTQYGPHELFITDPRG